MKDQIEEAQKEYIKSLVTVNGMVLDKHDKAVIAHAFTFGFLSGRKQEAEDALENAKQRVEVMTRLARPPENR